MVSLIWPSNRTVQVFLLNDHIENSPNLNGNDEKIHLYASATQVLMLLKSLTQHVLKSETVHPTIQNSFLESRKTQVSWQKIDQKVTSAISCQHRTSRQCIYWMRTRTISSLSWPIMHLGHNLGQACQFRWRFIFGVLGCNTQSPYVYNMFLPIWERLRV